MNGLKHRVALADVCAAGSADAALELRRLIGDYIAVEIRENEYLEVAAALLVDELRRCLLYTSDAADDCVTV